MSHQLLFEIEQAVEQRVEEIGAGHPEWPCRKGCDECCRRLASVPRVSRVEWLRLETVLTDELRERIRASKGAARPVTCPLLDTAAGACRVYGARPIACRAYGFYAERGAVLGCGRIEAMPGDVIWGNQLALEERLDLLGPARELADWLDGTY